MIPCISKESLKLLVGTADERYQFSPEYFRNTHYPQVLRRYYQNQLASEVTEQELLNDLFEVDANGNRVYLLFGSTGSGKSELLCWLRDQWQKLDLDRPVIRISRSELNPQLFIRKCYEALGINPNIKIDENRWDMLLQKPITIINQMIWSALAEFFSTDDEIVPIALLLRSIIERNITEFTKQIHRGKIKKPLNILSHEQYNNLLEKTTLSIPLDYFKIRQSLTQKLDHFLFQGTDLPTLFKKLSLDLIKNKIRPLLLIDDLVQSINLYATDILDNLINLEEGSWDVVVGLTPGGLQDSIKGNELLQRIQHLDTIDDRVRKLWLSDEMGKEFYNLDREQAVPYIHRYLTELKSTEGYVCSTTCSNFRNCSKMVVDGQSEMDVQLLPFNQHFIRRIYDGIHVGKGKLRYTVLHLKEIMKFFQKGDFNKSLNRVHVLVHRERFVEYENMLIKSLAEWYCDSTSTQVTLSSDFLTQYGLFQKDVTLPIYDLRQNENTMLPESDQIKKLDIPLNVRDWVEMKHVNEELLEPIRLGVSSLVNDVIKATYISRPFTPRNGAFIQRKEIEHRSKYPISFSGNLKIRKEIRVERSFSAIDVSNYQLLKPSERALRFQRLSVNINTAQWVYQTEILHDEWRKEFEIGIGQLAHNFSYQFFHWVLGWTTLQNVNWINIIKTPFTKELLETATEISKDSFFLRDNMVDASLLEECFIDHSFENWLLTFNPPRLLEQYQVGNISFPIFIEQFRRDYKKFKQELCIVYTEVLRDRQKLIPLIQIKEFDFGNEYVELIGTRIETGELTLQMIKKFVDMDQLIIQEDLENSYQFLHVKQKEITQEFNEWVKISNEVLHYFNEMRVYIPEIKSMSIQFPWDENKLDELKRKWSYMRNVTEQLQRCLLNTPQTLLKLLLENNVSSSSILDLKQMWRKISIEGRKLCIGEEPDESISKSLKEWGQVNFFQLGNEVKEALIKQKDTVFFLELIAKDRDWALKLNTVDEIINGIKMDPQLRPAIRRHLMKLAKSGTSTLPPLQWKRLLEDLEESCPNLFEAMRIQIIVSGKINASN